MDLLACFLRAVNVGGRRTTNDELVSAAVNAGFDDARAYQAAGNLVVAADGRDPVEVATLLEEAIAADLGFESEVIVRDANGLAEALAGVPWDDDQVAAAKGKPQVVLCRVEPTAAVVADVHALAGDTDLLELVGRDLHWLPLGGTARADMDTNRMYRLLHPATSRTVGTLERMRSKFFVS